MTAAPENLATEAADSPGKESNNGDVPGTLDVPKAAKVRAQQNSVKDKAKLKAKKAKQKKDHLKKKNDNIRLYDQPLNIAGRTTLPLQIDQLDPHGRNPSKLISLLQVAKPSLNARGCPSHLWHNSNFRKKPSLRFPYEEWMNSVVNPWDGELFCAMSSCVINSFFGCLPAFS